MKRFLRVISSIKNAFLLSSWQIFYSTKSIKFLDKKRLLSDLFKSESLSDTDEAL